MNRIEINGVPCFGNLTDSSNIEVLFDDEAYDFIWITRDPELFPDWQSIVDHFKDGEQILAELCSDDE